MNDDTKQRFIEKLQEYKQFTRTTVRYGDSEKDIRHVAYPALGLAGEVGELLEYFTDNNQVVDEVFISEFVSEVGDILWMMIRLADSMFPDGVFAMMPFDYEWLVNGHIHDGTSRERVYQLGKFDSPRGTIDYAINSLSAMALEVSGKVAKIVRGDKSSPTKAVEVMEILDSMLYLCILLTHWILQGYPLLPAYSHYYTDNLDKTEKVIALFELVDGNTRKLSARVENNTIKGDGHDR